MSERTLPHDDTSHDDVASAASREPSAVEMPQIEPLLGIAEFVTLAQIRPHVRKPLETWMRTVAKKDPQGHYPLGDWQAFYQAMLAYS